MHVLNISFDVLDKTNNKFGASANKLLPRTLNALITELLGSIYSF